MKRSSVPIIASLLAMLIGLPPATHADQPAETTTRQSDSPFVLVFIDARTEKAIGPDHADRSLFARAIEKSADFGARGLPPSLYGMSVGLIVLVVCLVLFGVITGLVQALGMFHRY